MVEACVFNAGNEPKQNLGIKLRGLEADVDHALPVEPPPTAIIEKAWNVPADLEPKSGVRVRAELDLEGKNPRAFEAFADRRDLLP